MAKRKAQQDKPEMLDRVTLKLRGWSETMIRKFLPEPDDTAANKVHVSGSRRKLYDPARVERIEATEEFKQAKAKSHANRPKWKV